jgi:hypothetical protein
MASGHPAAKEINPGRSIPAMVVPRINDRDPDGQAIRARTKLEIANYCYENLTAFYSSWPAMAVESELHEIRTRDVTRPEGV